ncbi:portal protein [Streptomyces phage Olicious]|uniref:Portal protein n=7 Tax=Immanueltrevirus immanuel3 TaxID=2846399 RepID=A0A2H5BMJ1_9CAUD|nr:portal protein [Streptomyces phage Immanuel3]AUG87330.1 portal protein [Streptomyces phage HaugeAnator]AUG87394.1 portal protein [Streptomyces phage Percastrophe]AUG87458.1 portal protein [Streptomyces phage Romero]AUG87522.1 portal protein [Streptomyces phage ToriToki]AUG87586.1 portal protein [Streptomyces phage ZooBear]AZF95813.1 portal protein [Streptomyces phage Olicious]UJQ86861.1 portal protein [Streptomyces phage Treat]UVK59099.1 portal protein [Streptomyces phage JPandJE]
MALTIDKVAQKVESLRRASADRDQRQRDVHDVRSGDIENVIPGAMPDAWPKPIVANMIDTAARDMAEVMGSMPSVNCASGVITTDRAKKSSGKRTKIANAYVQHSQLQAGHQVTFCDYYNTFGMAAYVVEPDFENKTPRIRVESPLGIYPEMDLYGRIRSYTKVWREEAIHLVAKFPHLIRVLQHNEVGGQAEMGWEEREIEVIKYCDADQIIMYLPNHSNQIVDSMPNVLGKVYISIAKRPGFDLEIRGAFDDAIWVQLAKARMALLGLEATEKSVRAPLAVPRDVQKMTFGDDAIIRTDNPEGVRRVALDVPQYAFQEGAMLDNEARQAMRSPEVRSGNIDASIITGRGVQALMGGFNTVITTGQSVIAQALSKAIEMCFEIDEKLWPGEKKTVSGVVQGTPFEETYTPRKDIAGAYGVDVTYGFAAGQDPARAIVALLQLRGDQLVSRDFVQRQLPMDLDVVQLQTQIDNEQFTDALKQGIMGYMQAILPMAQQGGMDPVDPLTKMAKLIEEREKGTPVHDAVLKVFKPKEQAAGAAQDPLAALMGGGGPAAPGGAGGAPGASTAPGGAGNPQGFDMMSLLSGLTGKGEATMSARTQRQAGI